MKKQKPWRDYFENILIAIFLALVVRTFILTGYKVPTGSMVPTLKPGDFIFAFRLPYGVKVPLIKEKIAGQPPRRGEVVVFSYPEQPRTSYVKRVIGLPGDVVRIEAGVISVNNKELLLSEADSGVIQDLPNFEYQQVFVEHSASGDHKIMKLRDATAKSFGPLVVPPDEVFLMGDNRDASDDSRYWGTVPMSRIEGRVVFIWLSLDWNHDATTPLGSRFPSVRWNRVFTSL